MERERCGQTLLKARELLCRAVGSAHVVRCMAEILDDLTDQEASFTFEQLCVQYGLHGLPVSGQTETCSGYLLYIDSELQS